MSKKSKELQQQPGRSWQSNGKGNRRGDAESPANKRILKAVTVGIQQAVALREARAEARRLRRASPPARQVFSCPECGAPVADSVAGREGHARRMPKCKEAVER